MTQLRDRFIIFSAGVRAPHAYVERHGTDAAVADLGSGVVAIAAAYFACVLVLGLATALPTGLGSAARRVISRIAPCVVIRVVASATGTALLAAPAVAAAGAAASGSGAVPAMPATSVSAIPAPILPTTNAPSASRSRVLVRPGDCLWSIARSALPRDATAQQTVAAVTQWYSTNRDVIGPDPGLISPGQHLLPPSSSEQP